MYVVTPVHRTSSSKQVEVIEMKNRLLFALVLTTIIAALITGLAITFLATRQVSSSQESPLVGGFVPLYELAEKNYINSTRKPTIFNRGMNCEKFINRCCTKRKR